MKRIETINMSSPEEIADEIKSRVEIKPILAGSMWPMIINEELAILKEKQYQLQLQTLKTLTL